MPGATRFSSTRREQALAEQAHNRTALAFLVMVLTPLFFSTNVVLGRGVVGDISPFLLAFIRWTAVALVLSPFIWREWVTIRAVLKKRALRIALLGFLGMWICGAGVYIALGHTTATNGNLIYTTSPVIIILMEALFLGRRIGWREGLGSLVAFIGVAIIILRGDPGALLALDFNIGDLLFVGAAISWAVYSIVYRDPVLSRLSNLALFACVALAGAVEIAPFAAWELLSGESLPRAPSVWASVGGIVFFASLLAFSGFQFGVRALGASLTGIFMYLLPVYGVLMAVLFLGERFESFHLVGILGVMGGLVLATFPVAWLRRG